MAFTGEVACLGDDFNEAFLDLEALLSVGLRLPIRTMLLSAGAIGGKVELLGALRTFDELGIRFYATGGTPAFLEECGLLAERLHCRWTAGTQASSKRYAMGRSILS